MISSELSKRQIGEESVIMINAPGFRIRLMAAPAFIGLLLLSKCVTAHPQSNSGIYNIPVQVRTLAIVSNDMPSELRQHIVLAYQGRTYPMEELAERIRQGLRDLGYANASVEIPQLASMPTPSPGQPVDVAVQVSAGAIYQTREIRFERVSVFPVELLRSQFPIADGSVFKATAIGKGLDNLKNLYASQGYINFGAIPKLQYEETQRTIALTVDLDEGARYSFGGLSFDGIEPHAGAGKELLATWGSIEGRPYDYRLLANWLAANARFLPGMEDAPQKAAEKYVSAHQVSENHRVNIELRFP
jgi:hypothetical protein